jgi:16S rRNA (guanine527-N7)-methyltransferase
VTCQQTTGFDPEPLQRYVDILLSRGVTWGLIGPRESDRIWDRHIYNSLALIELIPYGAHVIDVGSGAGLPGIPVALARPDLHMALLEPMLRRTSFLEQTVQELGIADRTQVIRQRAEDHRDTYDRVVARALAPLPKLLTWCIPLLRSNGAVLALKGASADAELKKAEKTLRQRHLHAETHLVRAIPDTDPARIICIKRTN